MDNPETLPTLNTQ